MTTAISKFHPLQPVAHDEAASCRLRAAEPLVDFDFERSFESRRRYRAFISARQLLALFDDSREHKSRLH